MKREILEDVIKSNKNVIIDGEISVGKTRNVSFALVDKMIEEKDSLVILDSKEEYIKKYYNRLKSNGYNIITLNLRDLDRTEGWNPLEYPYYLYKNGNQDRALDYLEDIVREIFRRDEDIDSFWSLSAADFLIGLLLGMFQDASESEINFNSVNAMVEVADRKYGISDYITEYFKNKNSNSAAYIYAQSTFWAPKETKGGILSEVRQKLKTYVCREKLCNLLNKTTFKLDAIGSKRTAVFVIAKDEDKKINSIAAMFIEQLFQVLIDLKSINKYNFILDNIDDVCFNYLSEMLGSGIARNIKFYVVTRSLVDLNNKYGSYINTLSNIIKVNSKNVEVDMNNEKVTFSNCFNGDVGEKGNFVIYPRILRNKIDVFDLGMFVKKLKAGQVNNNLKNSNSFGGLKSESVCEGRNFEVDDLLTRIDKKIAELSEKGQLERKNINSNVKKRESKNKNSIFESESIFISRDSQVNSDLSKEKFKIDDFMAKIDKKIAELERQEREAKLNCERDVSEFEQFKIKRASIF